MGLYFGETEITKLHNLAPQSGLDITGLWFGETNVYTVWQVYEGTLPATINANGADMRQYQIYGNTGGVGDDSGTANGYMVPISISDGTNSTTTPIYIGDAALQKDEYVDYKAGKVYRRTENLFNIDDLWDKGSNFSESYLLLGIESTRYIKISVPNGTYTVGTDAPDDTDPNIASVFVATAAESTPPSSTNGVFINRPRTITTTTEKLVICIRVQSTAGYQAFTKETFAPYYINVVAGSTVSDTAIPYLQPTDPPVALPALPTCEGTTIVDYAGQSVAVPEKVVFEYRKEGF